MNAAEGIAGLVGREFRQQVEVTAADDVEQRYLPGESFVPYHSMLAYTHLLGYGITVVGKDQRTGENQHTWHSKFHSTPDAALQEALQASVAI